MDKSLDATFFVTWGGPGTTGVPGGDSLENQRICTYSDFQRRIGIPFCLCPAKSDKSGYLAVDDGAGEMLSLPLLPPLLPVSGLPWLKTPLSHSVDANFGTA